MNNTISTTTDLYTLRCERIGAIKRRLRQMTDEELELPMLDPKMGLPLECHEMFWFVVFIFHVTEVSKIQPLEGKRLNQELQMSLFWIESRWGIEPERGLFSDRNTRDVLWALIHYLSSHNVFLYHTDHLSDDELLATMIYDLINNPLELEGKSETSSEHYDVLGGCSEEDNDIFFRYFADSDYRKDNECVYLDEGKEVPPMEPPPYSRDRGLPRHFGELFVDYESRRVLN